MHPCFLAHLSVFASLANPSLAAEFKGALPHLSAATIHDNDASDDAKDATLNRTIYAYAVWPIFIPRMIIIPEMITPNTLFPE